MDLSAISEELYEDSHGLLSRVELRRDSSLRILLSYVASSGEHRSIEIDCPSALNWNVTVGVVGYVEWHRTHPLLLEFTEPHEYLHHASAPESRLELLAVIENAKREFFGPFAQYSNLP
ncbi:MAG: hypothetical protein ACXVJO_17250, partial [Thermoanaerobaculia bacterium]